MKGESISQTDFSFLQSPIAQPLLRHMMYLSSFQARGKFGASGSTADDIATQTTTVDNLSSSTYAAGESLTETICQRNATTDLPCHKLLKEFTGTVWPYVLEADHMTLPLGSPVWIDKLRAHARHHSNFSRQLCFLTISQIAGSKKLRKSFAQSLSEKERQREAQAISDYLADLLKCEGETLPRDDGIKLVRLSYKIAQATRAYPVHLLLKDVNMESRPFAGGGFADVYKGKHLDKEVCVKQMRVFDRKVRLRFMTAYIREFILWSYMSHENVLPFYGLYLGDSGSRICLVSPLMRNGNMEAFLQKKPRTPRLPLVLDIIEGLLYLHSSKIVHGDLKAQNILISDEGRALLTDFGLSYIVITSGVRGSSDFAATGTANWMAPELMEDDSAIPTKQSDIWSFGCLCYEIFTGHYPFYQCRSRARVLFAVLSGELPVRPESDIPSEKLDDWTWNLMTSCCWRKKPHERCTSEVIRNIVAAHSIQDGLSKSCGKEKRSSFNHFKQNWPSHQLDYEHIAHILVRFAESPNCDRNHSGTVRT